MVDMLTAILTNFQLGSRRHRARDKGDGYTCTEAYGSVHDDRRGRSY